MMAQKPVVLPDPAAIGDISAPPFAALPDPSRLFSVRAARLRGLAEAHGLAPYLRFLAGLAEAQQAILGQLPEPHRPDAETIARAREFQMPPLDRGRISADPALMETFDRLFESLKWIEGPKAAAGALASVTAKNCAEREAMVTSVLSEALPFETLAEHVYVAAALQVHFARLAGSLNVASLVPVDDGICPACGGAPSSSMVVGWLGAHGARFCACFLCGTLWNMVRIKCVHCGSTEGIGYQEIDGGPGTVKAETCDKCHGWVKILQQHKDSAIEPIADDVASLALDLLMREGRYRRRGFNPFLAGY
jgi:FdhE protein